MKGKELLLIVISSFILTVIWIASNVYHAYATSTIDPLLRIQILPISPDFDMATIGKIRQRLHVQPETGTASSQPTPTPSIGSEPQIPPASENLTTPTPTITEDLTSDLPVIEESP